MLTTMLVVAPYYIHRIPAKAAGNDQRYDVKFYWPFGADGFPRSLHDLAMILALAAPLLFGVSVIWSFLIIKMEKGREQKSALAVGIFVLSGAVAYAARWKALVAWHLD